MFDDETAVSTDTPLLRRRSPRVLWVGGEGPMALPISRRLIIGSSAAADICLSDPLVSRVHAEVELRPDGVWVHDLSSRNGTFLGEVRVERARAPENGRIRVGLTDLRIEYEEGDSEVVAVWPEERYGRMVGRTRVMRELFATIDKVAHTDLSVLIQGETGSGKELVAEALHDHSARQAKPFVIVDCGALPESLLDAELFGHTKGAFTGANQARDGAFDAADGGTVFLDEIGELPLAMQPKLLRVLESGMVRRIGEPKHHKVDVRVIAATHRDLLEMVGRGEFREDLYFRLAVVPLVVPPLRDRLGDLPLLVSRFAGSGTTIDARLLEAMSKRAWRGNVRELRNFVQHAGALGSEDALARLRAVADGQPVSRRPSPPSAPPADRGETPNDEVFAQDYRGFREQWLERGEREYLRRLLERHGNNVSSAAREAGVDRTYVHRLIRRHNL